MAANLSSLTPITTTATALSNLVLVTPQSVVGYQPQNGFSYTTGSQTYTNPALLFHYEGEQNVVLESDITDHFIENNTALQDQISLKPVMITTHGFIGELNDIAPIGNAIIQTLQAKLTTISAYTPELTIVADIAYNEAFQAYQVAASAVTSAVSAWGSLDNLLVGGGYGENVIGNSGLANAVTGKNSSTIYNLMQTKQQLAFQQFYGYWYARTLFTVQTPWAVFQNMAIMRLRSIQESETQTISDFEITFKQINLAFTSTGSNQAAQAYQNRALNQNQAGNPVNNGTSSVNQLPSSSFGDAISGNVG